MTDEETLTDNEIGGREDDGGTFEGLRNELALGMTSYLNRIRNKDNQPLHDFWDSLNADLDRFADGEEMIRHYCFEISSDFASEHRTIRFELDETGFTVTDSTYDATFDSDTVSWSFGVLSDGEIEENVPDDSYFSAISDLLMSSDTPFVIEEPEEFRNTDD